MFNRATKALFNAHLQSIHARVTRNRLTTVFFLFGFVHCIAQGFIQSFLFTIDSQYSSFLSNITDTAITDAAKGNHNKSDFSITPATHTNLLGHSGDFQLEACDFIPHSRANCSHIFDSKMLLNSTSAHVASIDFNQATLSAGTSGSQVVLQAFDTDSQNSDKIVNITFNDQCLGTLLYAQQHLQNSQREDLAFLALQFWLFAISIIAMCYDSVPHVLTVLGTRILLTAWSIYALWRTEYQQSIFKQMIEEPRSPCHVKIFPTYSGTRIHYEIPDLVLNCTALGIAVYLSWSLLRVFNSEKVQHIGAPKEINRLYKYFLAVQVCLQLEVFVLMTWMGLWLDQLFNSYIHFISNRQEVYEALFTLHTILLVPWMLAGWFGIRYEKRTITAIFILMSIMFTVFACAMFIASTYRWTYYVWPCWACFATAALVLLLATTVLSMVCWKNFGKGLSQYLYAESALASSNFATEVFEPDVEKANKKAGKQFDNVEHFHIPTLSSSSSQSFYGSEQSSIVNLD